VAVSAGWERLEHRGCSLAYSVRGDGPPVVMIQGVGVSGSGWDPQIDALSGQYSCLSFDNRGIGASQPAGSPLTIDLMAADALRIMDALGWPSAHVAGHSMGGLIAQQIALTARERVRSLALLCTFARGSDVTRPSASMIWTGLRMQIGSRRQRRRAFLEIVMPAQLLADSDSDALAQRLAPIFGHDLADQPAIVRKQLAAMKPYDATPRLSEIGGLPTLVVSAARDRIAPPELGRALANGIPGARYVELPEDAHGVPIYGADRINALLIEHLS
jgi:pimeloyl-ACP methyl ester carboxylesterase